MKDKELEHCSFCGKTENEVAKLFAGRDGSLICDECIDQCYNMLIMDENQGRSFGEDEYLPMGDTIQIHQMEILKPEEIKSTRLNSSHANISYAVFCLKKKKKKKHKLLEKT